LCDLCGEGTATVGDHYVIVYPDGSSSRPDLCPDHAQGLEVFRDVARSRAKKAVVSMDDVLRARTRPRTVKSGAFPRRGEG